MSGRLRTLAHLAFEPMSGERMHDVFQARLKVMALLLIAWGVLVLGSAAVLVILT